MKYFTSQLQTRIFPVQTVPFFIVPDFYFASHCIVTTTCKSSLKNRCNWKRNLDQLTDHGLEYLLSLKVRAKQAEA